MFVFPCYRPARSRVKRWYRAVALVSWASSVPGRSVSACHVTAHRVSSRGIEIGCTSRAEWPIPVGRRSAACHRADVDQEPETDVSGQQSVIGLVDVIVVYGRRRLPAGVDHDTHRIWAFADKRGNTRAIDACPSSDGLVLEELLDSVLAVLPADTRQLEAAMRRSLVYRRAVDPDAPGAHPGRDRARPLVVGGTTPRRRVRTKSRWPS